MATPERKKLAGARIPESLWTEFRIETIRRGNTVAGGLQEAIRMYINS
jgi:hypothetical protein